MKKRTNMKRAEIFTALLFLALIVNLAASVTWIQAASQTISVKGSANRTVTVGKKFELEIQELKSVSDKYLKWTVSDTSIAAYEDKDRYGDDIDLIAKKAGMTKVTCENTKTKEKAVFTITVKNGTSSNTGKITLVGDAKRTVTEKQEFELRVKRSNGAKERNLRWTIANDKIVRFEDIDDANEGDDEMEFVAKKAGTTTIKCTDTATNQSVSFTITVKKAKAATESLTIVGNKTRTVKLRKEFELKVKRANGIKERDLRWSIADTSIVNFEEWNDANEGDDEMEFIALAAGTTTIKCTDTKNKKSVTFTITVR